MKISHWYFILLNVTANKDLCVLLACRYHKLHLRSSMVYVNYILSNFLNNVFLIFTHFLINKPLS